jgi:hypothetical protein
LKPKIDKAQRKALRFAYDLMRGCIGGSEYLSYVRGKALRTPDGRTHFYHRYWIEPDRAEDRPYLSEDVLAALEMLGYMETIRVTRQPIWLYRITRDGCDALGVDYPLYSEAFKAKAGDRFISRRARELQEREGLYRRHRGYEAHKLSMPKRWGQQPFNYRARKR